MTRLRAKAWSVRAAMFHVPLEALHQTLEAYLSGLNVSVAGHLSFFCLASKSQGFSSFDNQRKSYEGM